MGHIVNERRMFKHDFVRVQPGERIIPEDALDRYKDLKTAIEREPRWRERLVPECLIAALHRFHATASIQDSANAVRERAELAADELDSSLSLVRYIAWAIPAIGFIGTVRGIGDALSFAEQAVKGDISAVTTWLGLAFNSTFVGLSMCIFLMFFLHMVQARQEAFIIETQTFCRDKLIDVMKVPRKEETSTLFS
jgi:biopolymer transport protein ExbB/TolQ